MSKKKLLSVCVLLGTLLSCSSSSSDAGARSGGAGFGGMGADGADSDTDTDTDTDTSDSAVHSSYLEVSSVAKMIYDAVEAGEDVAPYIEAVLKAFGVPTLASDDADGALARIDGGLPFVTSRVVERMAAAYAEGRLVDAEGFAEGLTEQGVGLTFPFNASDTGLDATLLGTLLYSFTVAGETTPDMPLDAGQVLPSLVRELGQERARRMNLGTGDPAWGDGRLDPLQFTLLSFTIFAKPASATRTHTLSVGLRAPKLRLQGFEAIANLLKDNAEDGLTSAVQDIVEVPLDKKDAAKVSVCGSLILYGHKVTITNTPDLLWHAPQTPNVTAVEMTLTFEDDYHDNWARAVLGSAVTDLTGCAFPRKGPIEGKAVEWSVSSALEDHGAYDLTGAVTDDRGKSLANWRTVRDDTPVACQVFEKQRDAVGATEAVVSGLLPGWSTVETIVTFLNPKTGTQGNDPLTVMYYEVTVDDTCHSE